MNIRRFSIILVIAEVLAVFAFGTVLGPVLAQLFGVTLQNPLLLLVQQPDIALLPLSVDLLLVLFWQYLGWGFCAVLLFVLRPKTGKIQMVPQAELAKPWLILITCALIALPSLALTQAQEIWQFGARAPWFDILQQRPWDWQFWVFTAVGSFMLIPLLEEVFYRGYLLSRLASGWHAMPAILLTAILFAGSHAQYLKWDIFNLAMLLNISFVGVVLALATLYSRSLWPAIVAHALINLPLQPLPAVLMMLSAVVVLTLGWEKWAPFRQYIRTQFQAVTILTIFFAVVIGAVFVALFSQFAMQLAMLAAPVWLLLVLFRILQRTKVF